MKTTGVSNIPNFGLLFFFGTPYYALHFALYYVLHYTLLYTVHYAIHFALHYALHFALHYALHSTLHYSCIISASLITADGAYYCSVGSIWPFFSSS